MILQVRLPDPIDSPAPSTARADGVVTVLRRRVCPPVPPVPLRPAGSTGLVRLRPEAKGLRAEAGVLQEQGCLAGRRFGRK